MADNSFKVKKSLNIDPSATAGANPAAGDLRVDSSDANKLKFHNGSTEDTVLTISSALSASAAVVTDSGGVLSSASTTATEIGYVHGVTSAIQTQIDSKQASGNYITDLTGDVSATGPGSVAATVNTVGGSSAANVHTAEQLANAATDLNTASAIVKRDASGNFSAGTITAALSGNASTATSATSATKPASGSAHGAVTLDTSGNFQSVAPSTAGNYMRSNGTDFVASAIQAADVPTLNQNTSGNAATATAPAAGSAHGAVTLDTSAHFQTVAPGAAGNFLRSNGTDFASSAIQAADVPTLNQNTTGTASNVTGTVAIANGGTGQTSANAALNALLPTQTGKANQVLKTDGSNTSWTTVSGGGSKNYLSTMITSNGSNAISGNFEDGTTTGWNNFTCTLSSGVPTGAPSLSGANINLTASTSSVLSGAYSMNAQVASGSSWSAGTGIITNAFYIDTEDQAKVLAIKFYYSVLSGASLMNFSGTSSNSFALYIYDVTNSAWIQPAGVYGMTQSSGVGYTTGTFQTTSNSTQYRFAIVAINAVTTGTLKSINFDDFSVGPQTLAYGSPKTDRQSYTPTLSNFNSTSNVNFYWQRDGQDLLVSGAWLNGAAGSASGAAFSIPFTVDASKLPTRSGTNQYAVVGGGGSSAGELVVTYDTNDGNASSLRIGLSSLATGQANASSVVTATGQYVSVWARVPIVGWSSTVQMSSDTDTRVVAFKAYRSTNQTGFNPNNSAVKVNLDTSLTDTHGGFSGGKYTVPVSGNYVFSANVLFAATNVLASPYFIQFYKNGSAFENGIRITPPASQQFSVTSTSAVYALNVGDYIELYVTGTGNNSASTLTVVGDVFDTWLSGFRLSGPATIAATESVNMLYRDNSGQAVTANSTNFTYNTKVFDSHGAFSSGVYTCQVSGKYQVSACDYSSTSAVTVKVYINGSLYSTLFFATATNKTGSGSTLVQCNAGDTISLRADTSCTRGTSAPDQWIAIERVGN